jgi:hypothetical protein
MSGDKFETKRCKCPWCPEPREIEHSIIKEDAGQKILKCTDCKREFFERKPYVGAAVQKS